MSCTTPATNTPQAKAIIGVANCGAKKKAAAIMEIFKNTGVKAATQNLLYVFNTAPEKAVSEIKNK